jgi:predicted transcriptional regulator
MSNTVTLSPSIVKRLEKITASSRRTPQSIITSAIKEKLDYEEWALKQIDAGLEDMQAGRVYSKEEAMKRVSQARNERKKAA